MSDGFRRSLIINFGIIVGSFAVFFAAAYWLLSRVDSEVGKVADLRASADKRANALAILADLKRQAPEAERYQNRFDLLLPPEDQLLNFPKWLSDLSRVHSVTLNFSFQANPILPAANSAGYQSFSMDVGGGLDNVISFMRDLESPAQKFLSSVEIFDLTRAKETYSVRASGRAYFK